MSRTRDRLFAVLCFSGSLFLASAGDVTWSSLGMLVATGLIILTFVDGRPS